MREVGTTFGEAHVAPFESCGKSVMKADNQSDSFVNFGNSALGNAKKAKNDEFYTQWADIEREMNAYLEYDPDVFRGKVILLPCDDPEWSNFTKFFALHFKDYGIRKLISTSYSPFRKSGGAFYEPTCLKLPVRNITLPSL